MELLKLLKIVYVKYDNYVLCKDFHIYNCPMFNKNHVLTKEFVWDTRYIYKCVMQ